jgi:acyl dehydratase
VTSLLHFEDFHEGQRFALGPREITGEEIISFATEFDPQPFHLDEAAAQDSILGGLAASGWHSTSLLLRLICDAFLSRSAVMGSSGMDDVKWLKPVLAGDILTGAIEIKSLRNSASRPGTGIMKFDAHLADQHGTLKIQMTGMFFMGLFFVDKGRS